MVQGGGTSKAAGLGMVRSVNREDLDRNRHNVI